MKKIQWIVLNYTLPKEPSRYRVATWRALKKLGAVNIQQSMWILPNNKDNYISLEKITENIELNKGEALLMECDFFHEKHEDRVVSIINKVRDEEYQEFVSECEKYVKEIEKEISIEKFTYAELEEEEAELEKLIAWHKKIEDRDVFTSAKGSEAREILSKIKNIYDDYSEMVYKRETEQL